MDEIEYILDNNVFDDCIVGGDFNYDANRTSGFSNSVKSMLARIGLLSVWEKFPVDFTHLHTDSKSTSTIDHFFLNQRLLDLVEDAGPLHLGDNLSRHSPIMLKLKIEKLNVKSQQQAPFKPRRPAWYKATPEHKDEYTTLLDAKLRALVLPDTLTCQDVSCQCEDIDILCTLVETS